MGKLFLSDIPVQYEKEDCEDGQKGKHNGVVSTVKRSEQKQRQTEVISSCLKWLPFPFSYILFILGTQILRLEGDKLLAETDQ